MEVTIVCEECRRTWILGLSDALDFVKRHDLGHKLHSHYHG